MFGYQDSRLFPLDSGGKIMELEERLYASQVF